MRKLTFGFITMLLLGLMVVAADGATVYGGAARQASPTPTSVESPGHITLVLDEHLYLIEAVAGATPLDISAVWDSTHPGADEWVNIAPDGAWLLASSERFDPECNGWACLVIADLALTKIEVIRAAGLVVHADSGAIAAGGELIVYADSGGPHERDLWAITRDGAGWSAPHLLTVDSSYPFNIFPAISDDGRKMVFNCSADPYAIEGAALCEIDLASGALRVVLTPEQGPDGTATNATIHPDYDPDGTIVFEADWNGEQVWRLAPDATAPEVVNGDFSNDNSPCVLPDGRIVSLWLGRPGGQGYHELKIMNGDGTGDLMLMIDHDIADLGLGCGA